MIGAILGDIIGSAHEFRNRTKSENFELFNRDCRFTDDTVLTIATADAIINNKSFSDCYYTWANKYPRAGFGGKFRTWMYSNDPKPYNSFGNGSAMRVSPVGWLYDTYPQVMKMAFNSAVCTHNHPEGIKGAQAVASLIFFARQHYLDNRIMSQEDLRHICYTHYGYDVDRKLSNIRPTYKFNETCQGSVPEAIICFLESNSYEDTIRKAVSLGGDSDTQACIAGSIAEAYFGIPDTLKEKALTYLPQEMVDIVNQFYERINNNVNS